MNCWAVSRDLKSTILSEEDANFFEELSLKCLNKSLLEGSIEIWQLQLLIEELPEILPCKYPIVKDIIETLKNVISRYMLGKRMQNDWIGYKRLEYILRMLQIS